MEVGMQSNDSGFQSWDAVALVVHIVQHCEAWTRTTDAIFSCSNPTNP